MRLRRSAAVGVLAAVTTIAAAALAGGSASAPAGPLTGTNHIPALLGLFTDQPLLGGQVPPRFYKWVNKDVSVFVQFDRTRAAEIRTLRYLGISVRGTFCSETQPGGANAGFTHFHRLTAPAYAQGHGGPPGSEGYWFLWVATDQFDAADGRQIAPGVDYGFSPTPPPACGTTPRAAFEGPGAHVLTHAELAKIWNAFYDQPFQGGQVAPRRYRWVSGDVAVFVEFDNAKLAKAKAVRYVGIVKRGAFCSSDRPSADFTHFQRLSAKTYKQGAGGKPGQLGFWQLSLAVDSFTKPWGRVTPGVDRKFSPTPPPNCPKA